MQTVSLGQAIELFKTQFRSRYADSSIQIDGEGYDDEDLDLNVYAAGDQLELEQYATEVSRAVQSATGFFILPFVHTATVESDSGQ